MEYAYIFDKKGRIVGDYNKTSTNSIGVTDEPDKNNKIHHDRVNIIKKNPDISKPVNLGHERLGGGSVSRIRSGAGDLQTCKKLPSRRWGFRPPFFWSDWAFIFMITLRMTKPIETLTLAANRIEEGDLQYRVNIVRDGRGVGTLAAGFRQRWPTV